MTLKESEKPASAAPDMEITWHAMSAEQVVEELQVPLQNGLSTEEAARRLAKYGPNQLQEAPRRSFIMLVLDQLKSLVIILLIIASIISALLGETVDAIAIISIVILNAVLGVIQESRAEQALAALKKLAAPEAQVLRDGHRTSVPARELVPGDVVYLEAGNFIPADIRLLEAVNLKVEEAALTGESTAVQKNAASVLLPDAPLGDRKNTVFMGTVVSYGRGHGVVASTGMHTQLGLIASMLQEVEQEETPLQKRLDDLGKTLVYGSLIVVALVFIIGFIRALDAIGGWSQIFTEHGLQEIVDLFMIAVSLAIAAVPEGLPAVVTISLALGMQEMVRRHALIRRLSSVETLGSATVICSDKTGTLTQNAMTVTRLWVGGHFIDISGTGYKPEGEFFHEGKKIDIRDYPGAMTALWIGTLNNDAQLDQYTSEDGEITHRIVGDPTEGSILVAAAKAGLVTETMHSAFPRSGEIPFDSVRKRMVTVHTLVDPRMEIAPATVAGRTEQYAIAVKGAPDVVLGLCTHYLDINDQTVKPLDEAARQMILTANDEMTKDALRVLGMAYRVVSKLPDQENNDDLEKDLIYAGLVGMIDPARAEVKPALLNARGAGIRTIMITGDYPNTARAIAQSISLLRPGHDVRTGAELNELSDEEMREVVKTTDVFARVSPEHKMRIVDALRANDEVVAMTGDGVNDAPAIKRADIGVAMGITGTDVAKETADMVLTDDNYATIVSAVEQGRVIYANIRKFVFFLLSSNVAEIMIIFLATLTGLPTPLTAIQLLWLNLLTDGAPALALAMEKGDPDTMQQKPRAKTEPIINKTMGIGIIVQTFAQTGAVLTAFLIGLAWHLEAGAVVPEGMSTFLYLFQQNWNGVDVQTAETMAFMTLSLCELFRAYTVRSERASIFQLGVLSNKYMQYAVGLSILLLILVVTIPFLQPIFNTHNPSAIEWAIVFGLAIIPAIAEEITKFFLRRADAKERALRLAAD